MARIKNLAIYPFNEQVSLNDYVIGSTANNNGKTHNFRIMDILNLGNIPGQSQNIVLYGSITWVSGLTYYATEIGYIINGQFYVSPPSTITLEDADATFDRIDTFVVNTSNSVDVLEGIPSANPIEPTVDFETELRITIATIEAGAGEPQGVSIDLIYDENLQEPNEWNTSFSINSTNGVINLNASETPNSLTKHIEARGTTNKDSITFEKDTPILLSDISSLAFDLKLFNPNQIARIKIIYYLSGQAVGGTVINNGQFGLNSSSLDYQTINIPSSDISISGTSIDKMEFYLGTVSGFAYKIYYLDFVRFVSGIENPSLSGTFIALSDTPNGYGGKGGSVPAVLPTEDGLVFAPINQLPLSGVPSNQYVSDGDDINVFINNIDDEFDFVYSDIQGNADDIQGNADDIDSNLQSIIELQNKFPLTKETETAGVSIDLRYIGGCTTNVNLPNTATAYVTLLGTVLNGNQTTFIKSTTEPVSQTALSLYLTGTTGTIRIIITDRATGITTNYTTPYNTSLPQTASDFVSSHGATIFSTHGYIVTSLGNDIIFQGEWSGTVRFKTDSGDISAVRSGALSRKVFGAEFEPDTEMKMCFEYNGEHIEYYFLKVLA